MRHLIEEHWNDSEPLVLDFDGVVIASVSFFDESFGVLALRYPLAELTRRVKVENIRQPDRNLLNTIVLARDSERIGGSANPRIELMRLWQQRAQQFQDQMHFKYSSTSLCFDCAIAPVSEIAINDSHEELKSLLNRSVVHRRGYHFPISQYAQIVNRAGFVEGINDVPSYEHVWRFYAKWFFGYIENLRENEPAEFNLKPGRYLIFSRACAKVALVVLFAERIVGASGYDGPIELVFRWTDTANRRLVFNDPGMDLATYECREPEITEALYVTTLDLRSGWEDVAATVLRRLVSLFQVDNANQAIQTELQRFRQG